MQMCLWNHLRNHESQGLAADKDSPNGCFHSLISTSPVSYTSAPMSLYSCYYSDIKAAVRPDGASASLALQPRSDALVQCPLESKQSSVEGLSLPLSLLRPRYFEVTSHAPAEWAGSGQATRIDTHP